MTAKELIAMLEPYKDRKVVFFLQSALIGEEVLDFDTVTINNEDDEPEDGTVFVYLD